MIETRNRHFLTILLDRLLVRPLLNLGANAVATRVFIFAIHRAKFDYRINRGPWEHYHSIAQTEAIRLFAGPR